MVCVLGALLVRRIGHSHGGSDDQQKRLLEASKKVASMSALLGGLFLLKSVLQLVSAFDYLWPKERKLALSWIAFVDFFMTCAAYIVIIRHHGDKMEWGALMERRVSAAGARLSYIISQRPSLCGRDKFPDARPAPKKRESEQRVESCGSSVQTAIA